MGSEIPIAYSPCPNDTCIFYEMVQNKNNHGIQFREELLDVETLNQNALSGTSVLTKLSFAAYFHVVKNYALLPVGAALGKGCGPILISANKETVPPKGKEILIPGNLTTAHLLLKLYLENDFTPIPVKYNAIIGEMQRGRADYGVIIHEERFLYQEKGFATLIDLGEFWEKKTGLPIPLGGIAIRRDCTKDVSDSILNILQASVKKARTGPIPMEYIRKHSQSMDEKTISAHIQMFVNEYTEALREEGKEAVWALYQEFCRLEKIQPQNKSYLFYS